MLMLGLGLVAGAAAQSPIEPAQRRPVEQTLLTYPEWFLVHSPAEYAAFVRNRGPQDFPFVGHIGQLWGSYAAVTQAQLRAGYPANFGYHVMILVIAGSTTVEYALRFAYENTLGRVSAMTAGGVLTAEDRYAARVAQDYVDFIRREPWYLFDFKRALTGLWRDTPVWGSNVIRKWERRYALTTEYGIKALYAWLIERATRAAYGEAALTTQVVVARLPEEELTAPVRLVAALPDGRAVLELPRYYEFRKSATALAQRGVEIVEIAGNTGPLLVTVWTPTDGAASLPGTEVLFAQPLLTRPGYQRVALLMPVAGLCEFLRQAGARNLEVEHVYDY
jgi:hypothetical protein